VKYALVIVAPEDEWDPPGGAQREFDSLVRWWAELRERGTVVASARLAPPHTASTVSWRDRAPVVTDGPYVEAKEAVAGFLVVEVGSEAEALEIASSWPGRSGLRIEVRPLADQGLVSPEGETPPAGSRPGR
jgi:hypothetical protein